MRTYRPSMTDDEIIKGLERTASWVCDECKFHGEMCDGDKCEKVIAENAIDLINRQKADIESLTDELHRAKVEISNFFEQADSCCNEAIDVFAERLKDEMRLEDDCRYDCMNCPYECKGYVPIIDNLVKEMTEENNDN